MNHSPLSSAFDALADLLPRGCRLLLGLSGGIDSVVLLHGLKQTAELHGWLLSALHVHHGISPHADEWARFCLQLCQQWQIPLTVERVDIRPLREDLGLEAAARQLRHQALAAQDCDVIVLAHHADDQVETLLLQLLRGAGVRGASAMPVLLPRAQAPSLLRPLLYCQRQQIELYAQQHQLSWIEDESNEDIRYPRNFLRHQLLPLLAQRFPDYREPLLRSTRHFAEADDLLTELAQQDAAGKIDQGRLSVRCLQQLSAPRAKNLLRYFLTQQQVVLPQTAQLEQIWQQLCFARDDAQLCVTFGHWQIRRYQQYLYLNPTLPPFDPQFQLTWSGETQLTWSPLATQLFFKPQLAQADVPLLATDKLTGPLQLRLRQGGEQLQLQANRPRRLLKKILQEQQIPPWQRDRWPLLYCGEQLIAVPGIGITPAYQAALGQSGILLSL